MPRIRVNDFVRIPKFHENHPNAMARVVEVRDTMVVVSNLNQPFLGTLANVLFNRSEVEVVRD
jgi:hypothetical protein